jgi:hypothetical protein
MSHQTNDKIIDNVRINQPEIEIEIEIRERNGLLLRRISADLIDTAIEELQQFKRELLPTSFYCHG